MKKTYLLLTTLCSILFSSTPSISEALPYPDSDGQYQQGKPRGFWIDFEGDWLFWKPCISSIDAAATVTQNGSDKKVKYHNLDTDWHNGFRVALSLPDCFRKWSLSINYSRVHFSNSEDQLFNNYDANSGIVSPLILPRNGDSTLWKLAREELDFLYQDWNLLAYFRICNQRHTLLPYLGLSGLYITQEIEGKFNATDRFKETKWSLDYSGIGLRSGARYSYTICDGFSLYADGSVTLVEGANDISFTQTSIEDGLEAIVTINEDDCNHQTYGHRLAAGVFYRGCICSWSYRVHLGYEMINWYKLPNPRLFFDGTGGHKYARSTSKQTTDLAFHGMILGCSVMF